MRRRTLLLGLAGVGSLAACSADPAPQVPVPAAPSASASAVPILGSTTASSLGPQSVTTAYVPPPGTAPVTAYAIGRRVLPFSRGDRALPTTVFYPASGAAAQNPVDEAPLASGRFPLVLFSHGLTSQPADYAAMLARWAQAGIVVAAPTYPNTSNGAQHLDSSDIINQPADASHVIDTMLAPGDPLAGGIDGNRIAAAGHSAGGITTAGLFSARRDERLKAGLIFNGTDFQGTPFTGPAAAMLFVHGRKDETVTYRAGHAVFSAVPWSRAMLSITDGGHVTQGDDFEAVTTTSTDFLRWALYGDAAAKARLPQDAATGGVATFENQL
ncbi:alpha/beta hydrolase family protein [Actinoplanes sp. NPDC051859]|uniref:alpha/beta hydrolase family protein n=1 Tax=Actinoplanes sp. NPDC051859 TaxID=3363909 RepID=UPI00378ECA2D